MFGINPFLVTSEAAVTDWVTPTGALATYNEGQGVVLKLQARSRRGQPVTYVVVSGTLPPGLSLNPNTGLISGALEANTDPALDFQTYNFTIGAVDQ
jgi:fructose-1-phosphate kinase PfkB-like protein